MRIYQPKFNPKRAGFLRIKPTIKEESIELLSSKFNKIINKDSKIMKKICKWKVGSNHHSEEEENQNEFAVDF